MSTVKIGTPISLNEMLSITPLSNEYASSLTPRALSANVPKLEAELVSDA